MRNIKIVGIAALAAALLVGCGEQSVSETNGSSVESTTSSSSSVESSVKSKESNSSSTSGGQSSSSSEVADNQDILKSSQSSQGDSSIPDTSTDVSTSEPTHEPTSEPTTSSSSSNSKPTGETSKPTTSKPTSDTSTPTTSKPTSSSSQPNISTPTSPYWNPDAPGNKPGPYGGYYDASGKLHAIEAQVPLDSYGYPVVTFYAEDGSLTMTKADKEAARAEEERISAGGHADDGDYDWSKW